MPFMIFNIETVQPIEIWKSASIVGIRGRTGKFCGPVFSAATRNQDLALYFDLETCVNRGGRPLQVQEGQTTRSIFVSTTRSSSWKPLLTRSGRIYRYEIFAPGGIDVNLTLGASYQFPTQQEVCFPGGISRRYIRTVVYFEVTEPSTGRFRPYGPALDHIVRNVNFQLLPSLVERRLRAPRLLSSRELMLYFGTTDDKILQGPTKISDGLSCLKDTIFANGIDASFALSTQNQAYVFTSNICALVNFPTRNYNIQGPKRLIDSFHSSRNTIFASGIDSAFNSSSENEAYIFKGDKYALINFVPGTTSDYIIQGPKKITESFYSLKGTIFGNGMDAAFTSSRENDGMICRTRDKLDKCISITDQRRSLFRGQRRSPIVSTHYSALLSQKEGISAASSVENEAYMFTGDQYAILL